MDKVKKSLQDGQKPRLKSQRKTSYSRRMSANQKERRRTQNINTAFAELRRCIPNVPQDTKLSKIRTLRLATSYISFLREVLQTERNRESNDTAPLTLSKSSRTGNFHSSNNKNYNTTIFSVKVRCIK